MSLAITDDHRALAETAADFLTKRDARAASRALLDGADETVPELDLDQLGSRMTLQGIFVRRIQAELAAEKDPAMRERLEQALTFGSRAFAGKGPLYED